MTAKVRKPKGGPGFRACKGCGVTSDDKDLAVIDQGGRRGTIRRCMPCTWRYLVALGEHTEARKIYPDKPLTLFD